MSAPVTPRPTWGMRAAALVALALLASGCTSGGAGQSGAGAVAAMSGPGTSQSGAGSSTTPSATPSSATPRATATPVAEPAEDGDVNQVVEPGAEPPTEEVDLDQSVIVSGTGSKGVEVELSDLRSATATASGPGEVSGPALVVTVSVRNTSGGPVDLTQVSVNMTDSAGAPGAGMIGEPAKWLDGELAPDATAEGTYVFAVPESARRPISVSVSLGTTTTTAVFTGDAR